MDRIAGEEILSMFLPPLTIGGANYVLLGLTLIPIEIMAENPSFYFIPVKEIFCSFSLLERILDRKFYSMFCNKQQPVNFLWLAEKIMKIPTKLQFCESVPGQTYKRAF